MQLEAPRDGRPRTAAEWRAALPGSLSWPTRALAEPELAAALVDLLTRIEPAAMSGLPVEVSPRPPFGTRRWSSRCLGFYDGRRIWIRYVAETADEPINNKVEVGLHELAHRIVHLEKSASAGPHAAPFPDRLATLMDAADRRGLFSIRDYHTWVRNNRARMTARNAGHHYDRKVMQRLALLGHPPPWHEAFRPARQAPRSTSLSRRSRRSPVEQRDQAGEIQPPPLYPTDAGADLIQRVVRLVVQAPAAAVRVVVPRTILVRCMWPDVRMASHPRCDVCKVAAAHGKDQLVRIGPRP